MAIYDGSKPNLGALHPGGAIDSGWSRLEPLIDSRRLRELHLFGIPLVSFLKNPLTGKPDVITDEILAEKIVGAVALAEAELGMQLMPTQHQEKMPFDANEFRSLGFFMLRQRPVASIERLSVAASNGDEIYVVPQDWIETAYLARGQINIIPLNIATVGGGFIPASSNSGGAAFFLSILGQRPWIPAFWQVLYTTGWPDGKFPRIVNELIGTVAAIDILSMLATTYARSTSSSLSIDALSQSGSGPGAQIFKTRIDDLLVKKVMLIGKLKAAFGLKILSSNV
jgi:hypothetical protein